jgi:sporulation protein YlmC with PRC-barrel domain
MKDMFTAVLLASTALITAASAQQAQQGSQNQANATVADCDRLIVSLEQRRGPNAPITIEQARIYKRDANIQACRDALGRVEQASTADQDDPALANADASRIVVQQPAPAVRVQQASPTVTVQQPQPNVTVRQPQPEITVRQPAPTVTVDIPRPEIIVRMPRPDVNVAMAQPEVQVNQPRPEVQVIQPQTEPQVNVQPAQPQVLVQQPANAEANVQVQRSGEQPTVRYERAEPKVVVNQAQGEPKVRFERMDERQADQSQGRQAGSAQADAAAAQQMRSLRAAQLRDMDVLTAQGQRLGDVERIVRGQDDRVYAVIAHRGFLGLGEKRVAMPLDQTAWHDGRLVVSGLTVDQIRAMPAFQTNDPRYREAENTFAAPVRVAAIPPVRGDAAQASGRSAAIDPAERRRLARERIGDVETTGNIGQDRKQAGAAPTRSVRASQLEDLNIYNARGQLLGDIERVIVSPADNRQYVVIGHGGFLGLFEDEVALPLDRLFVRGDHVMIRGITDAELDQMADWRKRFAGARELEDNTTITVPIE